MTMNTIETKTPPWTIEELRITAINCDGCGATGHRAEMDCKACAGQGRFWHVKGGGGDQPSYDITEPFLEDAINVLVKQVTRDAIEDEALQWSNDKGQPVPPQAKSVRKAFAALGCAALVRGKPGILPGLS